MSAVTRQARIETQMTLARGESLLLTVGIPLFLLITLNATNFIAVNTDRRIDFLAPGIIALCVMSTSLVSLSISTGFDRYYGVLRRLHTTPLTARDLITAKVLSILVTEIFQIVILGGVAVALGWRPVGGLVAFALALVALLLASAAFAGIGLVLAGRLRAEINLAASNGLYLVLLLASGFVVPLDSFPSWMTSTVEFLPSGAVTDVLHSVTSSGELRISSLLTLVGWAIAAPLVASKTFRFD